MFSWVRLIAALLGATSAAAVAAPSADAMTVGVGDPILVGRVAISVPVVVSCTPFDPAFTYLGGSVGVSVQQAAGRAIASGSGSRSWSLTPGMGEPSPIFPCDGTEQTVTVPVSANAAGPPFHGGPAVVDVSAFASAGQPCFPGSTDCFTNFILQSGTAAAVKVRL